MTRCWGDLATIQAVMMGALPSLTIPSPRPAGPGPGPGRWVCLLTKAFAFQAGSQVIQRSVLCTHAHWG